jgi:hypothetical protein
LHTAEYVVCNNLTCYYLLDHFLYVYNLENGSHKLLSSQRIYGLWRLSDGSIYVDLLKKIQKLNVLSNEFELVWNVPSTHIMSQKHDILYAICSKSLYKKTGFREHRVNFRDDDNCCWQIDGDILIYRCSTDSHWYMQKKNQMAQKIENSCQYYTSCQFENGCVVLISKENYGILI